MNHKIVPAEQIAESALGEIDAGTALVIADSDGARAVEVANTITSNRTAIFVGNLANADEVAGAGLSDESSSTCSLASSGEDAAAAEFGAELFDR